MLGRFVVCWLICWAVLACFMLLAMLVSTSPFDQRMLPSIAFFTALVALMPAATRCGSPPGDRHGLKR